MSTPLQFVEQLSLRHGAVVEPVAEGLEILQPAALSAWGLPEHGRYAEQPAAGALWVGYGSPTLERLLAEATRVPVWAALRLELHAPPRENAARSAGERFVLRNAVHQLKGTTGGTAARMVVYTRYSLRADDRRDGLVEQAVSLRTRVAVSGFWESARQRGDLRPVSMPPGGSELAEGVEAALASSEAQARLQSSAFIAGVARRQERDLRRITEYFDGLRRELVKRSQRAKVTRADLKLKEEAIERERAAKLRETHERGQCHYEAALAAAIWVDAPVSTVTLEVRRRKGQRTLELEYDHATAILLGPRCDGCGLEAARPALCDERLHALCARCIPSAEGRWRCPACR